MHSWENLRNCISRPLLNVWWTSCKRWFLRNSVHNLSQLLIEIFKVKINLIPEIMNEFFKHIECSYPFRNESRFTSWNILIARYGIETAAFVSSRIWSYMPSEPNKSTSVNEFRSIIKTWKPENCQCKLCKTCLQKIIEYNNKVFCQTLFNVQRHFSPCKDIDPQKDIFHLTYLLQVINK